jgi:RNA polymerase sigma-70 factor (ECF subfamily)
MAHHPDPEETFVQLVVSHQAALRAFVLALLPGSPEVDDVIQETNIEIWKKRGDFQIGTNFKSWIFSVAKFKVMSSWRDRQRRRDWAIPEEMLVKLVERIDEGYLSTTEVKQEALRKCLESLRPVDRGLILRRYIDGIGLGQLASEVGRSAESLKVSLHRIRMVLRGCVCRRIERKETLS